MRNQKKVMLIVFVLFMLLGSTMVVLATGQILDENIPASWFEAPKNASEWGIKEFNQSPMLDKLVATGELPPLEQRLPVDPPVIEPFEKIGKYGGTAIVWGTGLDYGGDVRYLEMFPSAGQPTPDGAKKVPYYLKDWEYSNDYKELTLYLREGVKYSDGTPLTADDYIYWWKHYANNSDLQPVSPQEWTFPLLDVTAKDKYTVTLHFGKPNPNYARFNFQNHMGAENNLRPSSFMKNFHPDFVGIEKVKEMAENVGLENWYDYYSRVANDSEVHPEYEQQVPVLRPYIAVERTETTLLLERNPYYPFVDTEGNQLPYIDKILIKLANSPELAAMKAATGEADICGRYTTISSVPLYKKNEQKEDYKTFLYKKPEGTDVGIQFNLTNKEKKIRDIFQNVYFRRALSLAIDRNAINEKVYYGSAIPGQVAVLPTSDLYKEKYGNAYADFDLDKANALLDEIGLKDVNNDGYRELPNGDLFKPTFMYCDYGTADPTKVLELIKGNWGQVGININLKMVSRQLHDQLIMSNDFDISCFKISSGEWRLGSPRSTTYWLAPVDYTAPNSPWPGWESWVMTNGDEGMEPPEQIKELIKVGQTLITTLDNEEYKKSAEILFEEQAENLWTIGTVGMSPQPIIVANRLKNIPSKGFWGWGLRYMRPMYPVQFYLDEQN